MCRHFLTRLAMPRNCRNINGVWDFGRIASESQCAVFRVGFHHMEWAFTTSKKLYFGKRGTQRLQRKQKATEEDFGEEGTKDIRGSLRENRSGLLFLRTLR